MADEEVVEEVPTEETKVEEPKPQEPTEEELQIQSAKDELVQLGKAKAEALAEISRIRQEKQTLKKSKATDEEEVPKIDLNDPSAKAWDNHMSEKVKPLQEYEEKARAEVREFALQQFLKGKPALAKNPEKVKELVNVYDRLHTASERTVEGVLMDLNKSYGAITYEEREVADYQERLSKAQADEQFSQAAISKGATGYQGNKPEKKRVLTKEEEHILANWEASGAPKM